MSWLIVIQGPDRGRRWEWSGARLTIGRDAQCALRLHDDQISRQHAELTRTSEDHLLADLKSSNGTFLNGGRVTQAAVRHGDRIRVGRTELLFNNAGPVPNAAELAKRIDVVGRSDDRDSEFLHTVAANQGGDFLAHPESQPERMQSALANLAVMYEASQAVNRIGDIGQLLEHIMDLAFRSVPADRGCIALFDPESGKLKPTAVRFAAGVDPEERIRVSRTILEYAFKECQGVLALDEGRDARFASSKSMAKFGIREAMCAPLRGRHETLGAIYLDVRGDNKKWLATGKSSRFLPTHLELLVAIAHQAGLALEDNRFHQAMLQAERLATVGQAFASISHHIKNVLQGVLSANELVDFGLKQNDLPLVQQGWQLVRRNQKRIYSLVTDMLTLSKERPPELALIDFGAIAVDVHSLMEARAREMKITLETEVDPRLPKGMGDSEALHRALLNLVSNAMDAVAERENPRVVVRCQFNVEENKFLIAVEDNGPGIEPDDVDRIFQVFVSTKGSRGTGLGLPVTQKILREHDGDVELQTNVGVGSTFTMIVPLRHARDATVRREPEDSDEA